MWINIFCYRHNRRLVNQFVIITLTNNYKSYNQTVKLLSTSHQCALNLHLVLRISTSVSGTSSPIVSTIFLVFVGAPSRPLEPQWQWYLSQWITNRLSQSSPRAHPLDIDKFIEIFHDLLFCSNSDARISRK